MPDIDLKMYDGNYHDTDRVDNIFIHPEKCFYGANCGLANITIYRMCGWDDVFVNMTKHERGKTYEYTGD